MTQQIPLVWTKHIKDPKKREDFVLAVRNSTVALTRLVEMAEEDLNTLNNSDFSTKDFDQPSWALRQAFKNGQRAELNKIKNLLNFIKGNK